MEVLFRTSGILRCTFVLTFFRTIVPVVQLVVSMQGIESSRHVPRSRPRTFGYGRLHANSRVIDQHSGPLPRVVGRGVFSGTRYSNYPGYVKHRAVITDKILVAQHPNVPNTHGLAVSLVSMNPAGSVSSGGDVQNRLALPCFGPVWGYVNDTSSPYWAARVARPMYDDGCMTLSQRFRQMRCTASSVSVKVVDFGTSNITNGDYNAQDDLAMNPLELFITMDPFVNPGLSGGMGFDESWLRRYRACPIVNWSRPSPNNPDHMPSVLAHTSMRSVFPLMDGWTTSNTTSTYRSFSSDTQAAWPSNYLSPAAQHSQLYWQIGVVWPGGDTGDATNTYWGCHLQVTMYYDCIFYEPTYYDMYPYFFPDGQLAAVRQRLLDSAQRELGIFDRTSDSHDDLSDPTQDQEDEAMEDEPIVDVTPPMVAAADVTTKKRMRPTNWATLPPQARSLSKAAPKSPLRK